MTPLHGLYRPCRRFSHIYHPQTLLSAGVAKGVSLISNSWFAGLPLQATFPVSLTGALGLQTAHFLSGHLGDLFILAKQQYARQGM